MSDHPDPELLDLELIGNSPKAQPPGAIPIKITPIERSLTDDRDAPALELFDEIYLPVQGFVFFSEEEKAVIGHPAMQRLRQVYQLGQTYYVYPGATHTRFEHVQGTVSVVATIAAHIERNSAVSKKRDRDSEHSKWRVGGALNNTEIAFVRLAALLHDIGHLPAGHTLEDELGLLDKHDHKKRLDRVCLETAWYGTSGWESLADLIRRFYQKFIPSHLEVDAYELLLSIILKGVEAPLRQDELKSLVRLDACRDIVGNTVCADLLDYLFRDWYHIGKAVPFEERLYQYMQMRSVEASQNDGVALEKFVIWVGEEPNVKSDAFSAILSLLERRYELAEAVLFHKTKCLATAMLERGLLELYGNLLESDEDEDGGARDNLVSELLEHSDLSMLKFFQDGAGENERLRLLFANLRARKLFKTLFSHRCDQRGPKADKTIRRHYGAVGAAGARNRLVALRKLEEEFGLPKCSLAMYCPSKKMNAKVAQVQVCIDDDVTVLSELEGREQGVQGHLKAQIDRFRTLWRLHVGIDQEVLNAMTSRKVDYLKEAIERVVLGLGTDQEIERSSAQIARFLAEDRDSPHFGRHPLDDGAGGVRNVAARSDKRLTIEKYPSTYPTFASYYADNG